MSSGIWRRVARWKSTELPSSGLKRKPNMLSASRIFQTLMTEVACSSETSAHFQRPTWCYIPQLHSLLYPFLHIVSTDLMLKTGAETYPSHFECLRLEFWPRKGASLHSSNPMSIFINLGCLFKETIQVRGLLWHFKKAYFFTVNYYTKPPSWRTNSCWLSTTVYSVYL
jgi:hypothetical protein